MVVDSGDAEQREQTVHVVLVGLGVVRVADIATHGEAEKLSAEVIFETSAEDLLSVVEILRSNETDDGVDKHGSEAAGDGVGAGLERLLVDAVVGAGGKGAPLPGLEIHHVVAEGATLK